MSLQGIKAFVQKHRHVNWALADQAIVSGSNFITGILLARFLGPEGFGLFVLLNAAILYVNSLQGALIFSPMLSTAPQLPEPSRLKYLQGVYCLQILLSVGLAVFALCVGYIIYRLGIPKLSNVLQPANLLAVCFAILAFQLQEWQRRYYFVLENARAAFGNDVISYLGQVAVLLLVTRMGYLTVVNTFWVIGFTSFAAFAVGCVLSRLLPVFSHALGVLKDIWTIGRDYFVAWQFQWMGSQGVLMVGANALGAHAAGSVRAAQNIIGPINILFLAMENVVPVVAARKYAVNGLMGLSAYLWKIVLVGTVLLLPVLGVLATFSTEITQLLYGASYQSSAHLVIWQACTVFLQFYLRQAFFLARTLSATGVVIRAGIVMAICPVAVVFLMVKQYQETAIMAALLTGTAAGLVYTLIEMQPVLRKEKQKTLEKNNG